MRVRKDAEMRHGCVIVPVGRRGTSSMVFDDEAAVGDIVPSAQPGLQGTYYIGGVLRNNHELNYTGNTRK